MGKSQRDKGARGERSLVLHLNLKGYDARRVIRTRAVKGFEDDDVVDVEVYGDDGKVQYTFENKCRKNAFKTIYQLYYAERVDGVLRFGLGDNGPFVAISTDFEKLLAARDAYFPIREPNRTLTKILNMREWLKGAMFLVIKDNNKPPMFIRYWS